MESAKLRDIEMKDPNNFVKLIDGVLLSFGLL